MATVVEGTVGPAAVSGQAHSIAEFIDRWIYVFMAGLFVATALTGFIPTSLEKIAAVQAGQRPPFPVVLHVHATLMATWLLLLLTQTTLMALRRPALHKRLGMASMVVAPAMVLTGFILVPTMFAFNWAMLDAAPPGPPTAEIEVGRDFFSSLVAAQIAAGTMFAVLLVLALRARRSDPGFHKRMMILATVVPLPAAIDRIAWLPTTYPESYVSPFLYTTAWIAPMLVWDLVRHKRLHRAYKMWLAIFVPANLLVIYLWWTPGWMSFAQRLMGVA
jgi:hypothetical protein